MKSTALIAALAAATLVGAVMIDAAAADTTAKPEYPTARIWEPPVNCAAPQAVFQVRRMAGDTPATVQLWRAGGPLLAEVPLDIKSEVTVLRDPAPLGHEVRQYRLRLVPDGRVSREIAALVVDGRVCP